MDVFSVFIIIVERHLIIIYNIIIDFVFLALEIKIKLLTLRMSCLICLKMRRLDFYQWENF